MISSLISQYHHNINILPNPNWAEVEFTLDGFTLATSQPDWLVFDLPID